MNGWCIENILHQHVDLKPPACLKRVVSCTQSYQKRKFCTSSVDGHRLSVFINVLWPALKPLLSLFSLESFNIYGCTLIIPEIQRANTNLACLLCLPYFRREIWTEADLIDFLVTSISLSLLYLNFWVFSGTTPVQSFLALIKLFFFSFYSLWPLGSTSLGKQKKKKTILTTKYSQVNYKGWAGTMNSCQHLHWDFFFVFCFLTYRSSKGRGG